MPLVTKLTLSTYMNTLNDNQQNCRSKFVALSEPQKADVFDHSIAFKNYANITFKL